MQPQEIRDKLLERFGAAKIVDYVEPVGDPFIVVATDAFIEVMTHLRDNPELKFDFLSDVCGLDWPADNRIESVYHLYSMDHGHHVVIKARLPRENPEVESVAGLWPAADWHEREAYDMFGIIYKNHPNLRRILLAEDWEGFPLRKDFVYPETIHGVSNLP